MSMYEHSLWKGNKNVITSAQRYAQYQMDYFDNEGRNPSNVVSFECLGQEIINPFVDPTAREELSIDEAYAYYGIANMDDFVERAYRNQIRDIFYRNYVIPYNPDTGTFSEGKMMGDGHIAFDFWGDTEYTLYVWLDDEDTLHIENERGEDVTEYAEEQDWTEEDVRHIQFGHLEDKGDE